MASGAKQRKAPGKFRKPGESFNISANKQAMAKASGRLDTVRMVHIPGSSSSGTRGFAMCRICGQHHSIFQHTVARILGVLFVDLREI